MKFKLKKFKSKLSLLIIFIFLIIVFVLFFNKSNTSENINNESTTEENIEYKEPITYSGEIDLNNKENVIVKGNTKTNISEILLKDREYEGLKLINTSLIAERDISKFKVTLVNNSGKDYNQKNVTFVFKDKKGKTTIKIDTTIPTILNGESNTLDLWCLNDLVNSYDYIIE